MTDWSKNIKLNGLHPRELRDELMEDTNDQTQNNNKPVKKARDSACIEGVR